jgi:hypothetical protein
MVAQLVSWKSFYDYFILQSIMETLLTQHAQQFTSHLTLASKVKVNCRQTTTSIEQTA